MTVGMLVADLCRRGVVLTPDGTGFRYRAPRGALTDADRAALRQYRDELLALLRDVGSLQADGIATCISERHTRLSDAERDRLDGEGGAGDVLALLVLAGLSKPIAPPTVEAVADVATRITGALAPDGSGWCVLSSRVLNAEVLCVRDTDVAVPEVLAALPRFERDELAVLAQQRPDADALRAVVDVKRVMGGRVVRHTDEPLVPARQVCPPTKITTTANTQHAVEPAQGELAAKRSSSGT